MYYKCELLIGGYAYGVTDLIRNWDDMTVSFKRNNYDGVSRTFTDKFEFVKGARELLLEEYRKNYLHASASVVISTRNNSWEWTERFRCALNFSTLTDEGYVLSMNAVDDSVASLIKAKQGTQYEYSVDVIKDGKPLLYDGLEMTNNIVMTMPPNSQEGDAVELPIDKNGYYSVPLYTETSEIIRKGEVELTDQIGSFYNESDWVVDDPYFFKNKSNKSLTLMLAVKMDVFYNSQSSKRKDQLFIMGTAKGKLPIQFYSKDLSLIGFTEHLDIDVYVTLPPGYSIQMYFFSQYGKSAFVITNVRKPLTLTWNSRKDAVSLDVVKPVALLNRLLKSMNGGKDGLTGVIIPSGERRLDNALILAAESARKLPNAKIYSSFTKFCNWMSAVFGYVYDIKDKTITFRPRKDYFGNEVVKEIQNFNGYQMRVDSSLIYSQVNVGYEKQDYDSVNGKDEFRFTNIYNTGVTLTDNKIELISPYRADAYGMEFLTQKIGEETTDNESDNGVFFVCANDGGTNYILDRSMLISGVISPHTMFNVMYAPTTMIEANKDYLGGLVSNLVYASSGGNTDVVINGKMERRDIELDGGLFLVDEVEVETSDIEMPEDMTGVVEFSHQGEMVRGYYKSADFHYTRTKSAKITLIVKK
jgi:hypothetical protein